MFNTQTPYSILWLNQKKKWLYLSHPTQAYIQYFDHRYDLINSRKEDWSFHDYLGTLEQKKVLDNTSNIEVTHWMYEAGELLKDQELTDDRRPLVLYFTYSEKKILASDFFQKSTMNLKWHWLLTQTWTDYCDKFKKVYHELVEGNFYQLNLTSRWVLIYDQGLTQEDLLNEFFSQPDKLGAYAHASFIPEFAKLYLSNSPETLFQIDRTKKKISTRPIKGTRILENKKDKSKVWNDLCSDLKEQGELYMITDLLRNDLSMLGSLKTKVKKLKAPLEVVNLLHQYSLIENDLVESLDYFSLIKALFPGGSITGAPKKKVMEFTKFIEGDLRGFYCGSTLFDYQNKLQASINIRSAEIDLITRELTLGAGGGITLLSQPEEEFKEMKAKINSFISLFNGPYLS